MRLTALFLCVVGTLLVSVKTQAKDDSDKAAALALLRQGNAYLDKGEFQQALERFEEAYTRFPSAKIFYSEGQALRGLHRDAEARAAFQRFLLEADDASAEHRAEARKAMTELAAKPEATVTGERPASESKPVEKKAEKAKTSPVPTKVETVTTSGAEVPADSEQAPKSPPPTPPLLPPPAPSLPLGVGTTQPGAAPASEVSSPTVPPLAPAPIAARPPSPDGDGPKGDPLPDRGLVPDFLRALLVMPHVGWQFPIDAESSRIKSGYRVGGLLGLHINENWSLSGEFDFATWKFTSVECGECDLYFQNFVDVSRSIHHYAVNAILLGHVHWTWGELVGGPKLGWSVMSRAVPQDLSGSRQFNPKIVNGPQAGVEIGVLMPVFKWLAVGIVADVVYIRNALASGDFTPWVFNQVGISGTTLGSLGLAILF